MVIAIHTHFSRNHNCCWSRKYQIKKADNQEQRQIKAERAIGRSDKQAILKNCAPFTGCINKMNNTQADLDVVILMYNLIEFSGNYSKSSGSLYQFRRNESRKPIEDSESFKFKSILLNDAGIINV